MFLFLFNLIFPYLLILTRSLKSLGYIHNHLFSFHPVLTSRSFSVKPQFSGNFWEIKCETSLTEEVDSYSKWDYYTSDESENNQGEISDVDLTLSRHVKDHYFPRILFNRLRRKFGSTRESENFEGLPSPRKIADSNTWRREGYTRNTSRLYSCPSFPKYFRNRERKWRVKTTKTPKQIRKRKFSNMLFFTFRVHDEDSFTVTLQSHNFLGGGEELT